MPKLAAIKQGTKALQARLNNQPQRSTLSTSAEEAVLSVTQSQQMLLNALARLQQQVESSHQTMQKTIDTKPIMNELGGLRNSIGGIADPTQAIASSIRQIETLGKSLAKIELALDRLPTSFPEINIPEQQITYLSGVMLALDRLTNTNIDIPDLTPQLERLEKRLGNRVHEFVIERNPFTDLIDKIVVTEI